MSDTIEVPTRISLVKMIADSIATLHGKCDPEYGAAEAEAIADTLYLGGYVNEAPACPKVREQAKARTYTPTKQRGLVHNHGPAEGGGLDCAERRETDGSLRGACQPNQARNRRPTGKPIKVEVSYPWAS